MKPNRQIGRDILRFPSKVDCFIAPTDFLSRRIILAACTDHFTCIKLICCYFFQPCSEEINWDTSSTLHWPGLAGGQPGGAEVSVGSGGGGWWQEAEEAGERDMGSSSSSSPLDSSSEWLDSERHCGEEEEERQRIVGCAEQTLKLLSLKRSKQFRCIAQREGVRVILLLCAACSVFLQPLGGRQV